MADVFSREKRSDVMSRIRGAGNTTTELRLITLMRSHGIRGWRRNHNLLGRPDFTFPVQRVVFFVDGCFWHGCPVHGTKPKQNSEFWSEKIARNQARDRLVTRKLRTLGWRVLRIWEHELRRKNEGRLVGRLIKATAGVERERSASPLRNLRSTKLPP